MTTLLVNDAFNLNPVQASSLNIPKDYYINPTNTKGKQTGTTFVDRSGNFTADMKGATIIMAAPIDDKNYSYDAMILEVVSSTTLTLSVSQNIESTDYKIWYGGVQADQTGCLSVQRLLVGGEDSTLSLTKAFTITAAELASAGHVTLFPAVTSTTQYRVLDIKVSYSAAGLSGGGGDRLLAITDGTTVYNNAGITAALLGTPVNTVWGGTGNPLPGNVAISTPTAAGMPLYAAYTGGATDYSTGSITIVVTVEKIA